MHDRFFKRQATSTSAVEVATSTAPTDARGTHTTTVDLSFTDTNSTFLGLDLPLDFGCRNCSGTGELILTAIDLKLNNPFNTNDDDPIKTGLLQFDLKGLGLSIGLRAIPSENSKLEIPIFKTPRLGFNVCSPHPRVNAPLTTPQRQDCFPPE
jgi:hypothetical protein